MRPARMMNMPSHRNHSSFFFKKTTLRIPTKIMMEPRSIWNEEAVVKVSATYITDVAVTSHNAGGNRMNGE
jgi:hypothetical protein